LPIGRDVRLWDVAASSKWPTFSKLVISRRRRL
jgi:hypothetical protein